METSSETTQISKLSSVKSSKVIVEASTASLTERSSLSSIQGIESSANALPSDIRHSIDNVKGAEGLLANKLASIDLVRDIAVPEITSVAVGGNGDLSMSSTSSSSSSVSSVMKKSSAVASTEATVVLSKPPVESNVTIEDAPEDGDAGADVVVTVKVVKAGDIKDDEELCEVVKEEIVKCVEKNKAEDATAGDVVDAKDEKVVNGESSTTTTTKITTTTKTTTTTGPAAPKAAEEDKRADDNVEEVEEIEEEYEEVEEDEEEDEEVDNKDEGPEADGDKTLEVADGKSTKPLPPSIPEVVVDEQKPVVVANPTEEQQPTKPSENEQKPKQAEQKDVVDSVEEDQNIVALKERERELLRKQQELAQQIRQQQLLAQKLADENRLQLELQQQQQQQREQLQREQQKRQQEQEILKQQQQQQQQQQPPQQPQPIDHTLRFIDPPQQSSKFSSYEEKKDEKGYTQKIESYQSEESSNVSRKIDLQKIFTPATDAEEILPRNRKIYASSAFYSSNLHPTVEDQVELARRISDSLSDVNNQTSKGQSMYVNRKKRSVKWVHEGRGQGGHANTFDKEIDNYEEECKENNSEISREETDETPKRSPHDKIPLRLLMNPRGQIRDFNSQSDTLITETGLLSPDRCAEVVNALHMQKGRGAELFAKRRRKAENWIVDETNAGTQSPSNSTPSNCIVDNQYPPAKPPTSPNLLPAYSDAGKHRVQLNIHQEQVLEKYAKPGLKVVRSPWEAALETGSASSAFLEEQRHSPYPTTPTSFSPAPQFYNTERGVSPSLPPPQPSYGNRQDYPPQQQQQQQHKLPQSVYQPSKSSPANSQRDLAYKPSIPQGWKGPSMSLPREEQSLSLEEIQRYMKEVAEANENLHIADEEEVIGYIKRFVLEGKNSNESRVAQEVPIEQVRDVEQVRDEVKTKRICVREQLQQFEEYHRQLAIQKQQEEALLQLQREQAILSKKLREQKKQLQAQMQQQRQTKIVNEPEFAVSGRSIVESVIMGDESESNRIDEYIRVPVHSLISSFEEQTIDNNERLKSIKPDAVKKSPTLSSKGPSGGSRLPQEISSTAADNNKDMYVPKEIPLDSYAPPPAVNIKAQTAAAPWKPQSYEEQHQPGYYGSQSYAEPQSVPSSGHAFPLSKPHHSGGFSTPSYRYPGASPAAGIASPPKQQYLDPRSYQKVPQATSQTAAAVNFNPSPLPYDKLAKFEGADNDQQSGGFYHHHQGQQHLGVHRGGPKVRNTSPAPFGGNYGVASPAMSSPRPLSQPYSSSDGYDYASTATSTPSQFPSRATNFGKDQFLHGQNYNNAARGWRPSAGGNFVASPAPNYGNCRPQANSSHALTSALPYTDF